MRNLLVCIFAAVILSQAVESLRCYNCRGGNCVSTNICASNQDRCLTLLSTNPGSMRVSYYKRCGKQYECDLLRSLDSITVLACCGTDACNGS